MPTPDEMEAAIWREIGKIQDSYERRIVMNYRAGLDKIRSLMASMYEEFSGSDGVLTHAEMTKYNRLVAMERSIESIMDPVYSQNVRTVEQLAESVYEASYFRHAWKIDNQAGVALDWGVVPDAAVRRAADAEAFRQLKEIAIKQLKGDGLAGIDRTITQGLIQGWSYPKMARELKAYVEGETARYIRIARTEGHRASVQGTMDNLDAAEAMGIEMQQIWDATLDNRTRPEHGALDGVAKTEEGWNLGGQWVDGPGLSGDPAQDINCRCAVRGQIEGYPPEVRRIRDEGVVPYITYDDWIAKHQGEI
jgi:hypothetical protein